MKTDFNSHAELWSYLFSGGVVRYGSLIYRISNGGWLVRRWETLDDGIWQVANANFEDLDRVEKIEGGDMTEGKKFWIIIGSRDTELKQYKRHYNKKDAVCELDRLAQKEKGTSFYLLEALERRYVNTTMVTEVLK